MKKIVSVFLSFLLLFALLLPMQVLAAGIDENDPLYWEKLGDSFKDDHNEKEAAEAYARGAELALSLIKEEEAHHLEAFNLARSASSCYASLGQYESAVLLLEKIGDGLAEYGKTDNTLWLYKEADGLFDYFSMNEAEGRINEKLGDLYYQQGKHSEALAAYDIAAIRYDTDSFSTGVALGKLAELEALCGKTEEAARDYRSSAGYYLRDGYTDKAQELIWKSVELYKESDVSEAIRTLIGAVSELAMSDNSLQAIELLYKGYETFGPSREFAGPLSTIPTRYFESTGDLVSLAYACSVAADCYKAIGDTKTALDYYNYAADNYKQAYCYEDASRMEKLAKECSSLGTVFSEGNLLTFVIVAVIIVVAAVLAVVLCRRKRSAPKTNGDGSEK